MTAAYVEKKNKATKSIRKILISSLIICLFLLSLLLSNEISRYVMNGLTLSVRVIIPSVFPFLLITDLFITNIRLDKFVPVRFFFEKAFKISGSAISTFLCGLLCGFPIGAKMSLDLYKNRIISKCECERLMSFSNNASPAYVICVVGMALRNSLTDGITLYLIMLLSAFFTGIIIGLKKNKSANKGFIIGQKYSFTDSVKQSTEVCINICGFITTFAIICGLVKMIVKSSMMCALLISFFEIGNACTYLSELRSFDPFISFVFTSFSISFSGISVISQTVCIASSHTDISMRNHIKYKILQGTLSAIISMIIFPIIY